MSDAPIVITGHAYGQRATLEVSGDTLMWRARRGGELAENIATTVHDVRGASWHDRWWSPGGLALIGLGAIWAASETVAAGSVAIAIGIALVVWRRLRPRQFLMLDIGDRQLVLHVTADSAAPARELAQRVQHTLASGDEPRTTPTLP